MMINTLRFAPPDLDFDARWRFARRVQHAPEELNDVAGGSSCPPRDLNEVGVMIERDILRVERTGSLGRCGNQPFSASATA